MMQSSCHYFHLSIQEILPNTDSYHFGSPYFSLFCRLTFGQTMLLFFETIVVLALWYGDASLFVACRKHKQNNNRSAKVAGAPSNGYGKKQNGNIADEEEDEAAGNRPKVGMNFLAICFMR